MKPALTLCLLLLGSPLLSAQETGRLFHTPAERAQLDAEKYRNGETGDPSPRYQGLVQRSQGPTTLWVNGVPQQAQVPGKMQVGPLPATQNSAEGELLQGGKITVHPPRGTPRP